MLNDGRNPNEIAKKQVLEISQFKPGCDKADIDDPNIMEGRGCFFAKRCPKNCSMYVIGGIVFTLIYTGLWFFIAYKIDNDEIKWGNK